MKSKLIFLALTLVLCLGSTVPAMASGTGTVNSPTTVSAGSNHSGLIDANGSLWMWGLNEEGQLGNGGGGTAKTKGDFTYQTVPIKVLDNVVSVSSGGKNTAAIKTDGSLWIWGENYYGQLGNGSTKDSLVPIKVMDNVAAVSLGGSSVTSGYTAAIKTDGSLWMWGANDYGQLGKGEPGNSLVPIKVMDNVASVSLSEFRHVAAIKTDGSLWMWGRNGQGQLGNGSTKDSSVPIKVMENVTTVSLGAIHTAAVKTDGSLWTWGDNREGQLGNGSLRLKAINDGHGDFPIQTVPVKLIDGVVAVSSGSLHTIVVKTDGSVWSFGSSSNGNLGTVTGNGVDRYNNAMQTIPVKLSNLTARTKLPTAFYDVAANAYYTKAVIWAIDKGITKGTSATTFSPNKMCTTGEILTFLWKAQNSPEPTISNPFSDVTESHYYYKAALWAYEKGLVSGSMFRASVPSTRSMTVTYLWKLAGMPTSGTSNFADVSSSADYAQAVSWAVGKGIASGTENNIFSPDSICTRGQIVTFLYRAFAQLGEK